MKAINFSDPQQRQTMMLSVLGVVGLWVYITMLVVPNTQRLFSLGREVRTAHDQLTSFEHMLANEERIREQHERLQETVASLRSILPSEDQLPSMLEYLSDLANRSQVRIQTIFPKLSYTDEELEELLRTGQSSQPVYRTIPIQIDGLGSYHEIGTFLSLIETGSTPMEVEELRITADAKEFRRHKMKLVLNVFFAAAEVAAKTPEGAS